MGPTWECWPCTCILYVVVSLFRGTPIQTQNTRILIKTPKKLLLGCFGKPPCSTQRCRIERGKGGGGGRRE